MTQQSHPNDPPPAGDELLTISEVAAIVRTPSPPCATGATSAPGPAASASADESSTESATYGPG
jgi:hypothetical protein